MTMLRDAALSLGFTGGLVVDYPWSERSKKLFLVLIAPSRIKHLPSTDAPSATKGGPAGGFLGWVDSWGASPRRDAHVYV